MKSLTHICRPAGLLVSFFLSVNLLFAQNLPAVIAVSNAPFCLGAASLQLDELGGDGIAWSWEGPNGFLSSVKSPTIQSPSLADAGSYAVTVTGSNGLTNVGTVDVSIFPTPSFALQASYAVCLGGSVVLQSGNPGGICSWSPASGLDDPSSCSPLATPGSTTVYTLTQTNPWGCSASKSTTVAIRQPVQLVCQNLVTIALDEDGVVLVSPGTILKGTILADTFLKVSITDPATQQNLGNTVTCAQIGKTLLAKVHDVCNGNSCTGSIQIKDNLPPKISCPSLVVPCALPSYTPAYLGTQNVPNASPPASDNCGAPTLGYVDVFHNLDCDGPAIQGVADLSAYIERKWTAQDQQGNTAGCMQYILLKRVHLPELQMPANITIGCSSPNIQVGATGAPSVLFNGKKYPISPQSYNCELSAAYTDERLEICAGSYKIIRNWLVFDDCLSGSNVVPYNPVSHQQIIKVMDLAGPEMSCPADITVSTDPTGCCVQMNLPDLILSDNCSYVAGISAAISSKDSTNNAPNYHVEMAGSLADFVGNNLWQPDTLAVFGITPCLPVDTFTVEYRALDGCGNLQTCRFNLVVVDKTEPVAVCDQYTEVSISSGGKAEVSATVFDDGSYDFCCIKKFEARRLNGMCAGEPDNFGPTVDFCCVDVGKTIKIAMRVTDCSDNTNECNINVLVLDKVKPSCIPPSNVSVSCENFDPSLNAYGLPLVQDNCCIGNLKSTADYSAFDTFCNVGTILRNFVASDCNGLTNTCTQRIFVKYRNFYFLQMPSDANINKCDGTGNFGVPKFLNLDCELIGLSYEDQIFTQVPDACYKIIRKWQIINWCTYVPGKPCVNIPNPEPNPNPLDPNNLRGPILSLPGTGGLWDPTIISVLPGMPPTNYSALLDSNANCYLYDQYIKVLDLQDPKINVPPGMDLQCDLTANDPTLWNNTEWWEASTGKHDLCEGPVGLKISAVDSCAGTDLYIKYNLYLDLDQDGIQETVVNSASTDPSNVVYFGNAGNPNFSGGTPRSFDQRNVPASEKHQFALETYNLGNLKYASVKWNTLANPNQYVDPELPYGKHKIRWIVQDACGNESVREYGFTVKDCKPPSALCINGLSVNIGPSQSVGLWASDLLQYADDNCTPASQLLLAVQKTGVGNQFPQDASGNPQSSINFDCTSLGSQLVQLWVKDLAGNTDYCETYVVVQDNMGNCPSVSGTVAGLLMNPVDAGLAHASVELSGVSSQIPAFSFQTISDSLGAYSFQSVPFASDFSVTPHKDDDPLNGVSTYDLSLISRHILGLQPLSSPFQLIAADANKSGSVTNFDIIELRKLILGIYNNLPGNTSWRFVDREFVFPNPQNPFEAPIPESINAHEYQGAIPNANFVAVKVGDVNGNATTAARKSEERLGAAVNLELEQVPLFAGKEVCIPIKGPTGLLGMQFTLQVKDLIIREIIPGSGMRPDHFALFPDQRTLTVSWDGAGTPEFSLLVYPEKNGQIKDFLQVNGLITPAEAYLKVDGYTENRQIGILFMEGALKLDSQNGFELYANQPNPFVRATRIGFYLPEADVVRLMVSDQEGRPVLTQQYSMGKGAQTILLSRDQLGENGMWYYTISTRFGVASGKMVALDRP